MEEDNRTIEQKLKDSDIAYHAVSEELNRRLDEIDLLRQALRAIRNVYFIEYAHQIAEKGLKLEFGTLTKGK